jgi:hypothetical protein
MSTLVQEPLLSRLQNCCVRIRAGDGEDFGTGFFVADGTVATCAHVVGWHDTTKIEIFWHGRLPLSPIAVRLPEQFDRERTPAELFSGDNACPDVALLTVDIREHPCVLMDPSAQLNDDLYIYGYSDEHPEGDPITTKFEGFSHDKRSFKLKTGQVRPGVSGSPALNLQTGGVVGLVTQTRDTDSDLGGRGVSLSVLTEAFSDLPDKAEAYHRLHNDWHAELNEQRTERERATRKLSANQQDRLKMLRRVRGDWIDGVLKKNLYGEVGRIRLHMETRTDAVEKRWKDIVQAPGEPSTALSPDIPISKVFDDSEGALLILGAPGTGKTTLLLQLVHQLLDRAAQQKNYPIPVVYNLSSWSARRAPLAEWLATELNLRSYVPLQLARSWLENNQIIPLLDGLDEVRAEHQQACLEAINDFRVKNWDVPLAVCCRTADYDSMSKKLRLDTAIEVKPLSRAEVRDYLKGTGTDLSPVRAALEMEPLFWELLETPLMLWVAVLAARDGTLEFSPTDTFDQKAHRLLANFVDAMLNRRSPKSRYTRMQTTSWLCSLASILVQEKQTTFQLEDIDEEWLSTRFQRYLSKMITVIIGGFTVGLVFGVGRVLLVVLVDSASVIREFVFSYPSPSIEWFATVESARASSGLIFGFNSGFIGGIFFALVGTLAGLRAVDTLRISLTNISSRLARAAHVGLYVGPMFGLVLGFQHAMESGPKSGLIDGLRLALMYAIGFGLATLISAETIDTRTNPNQGTLRSGRMALTMGAICGLVVAIIDGLVVGLPVGLDHGPRTGLHVGLSIGLLHGMEVGPIYGLISGGLFSIRHFVLRFMLWGNRSAPLRYAPFLDYAVERAFLNRVGGGYKFVHARIMEYFDALKV